MLSTDRGELQRQATANAGRLHWVHWLVVALSTGLTLVAWSVTNTHVQERSAARFDREASRVLELVTERMRVYEDALWSGVSAIQASGGRMRPDQWLAFASSLRIETRYPGINGIGLIDCISSSRLDGYLQEQRIERPDFYVHPPHGESECFPITYIEPADANAAAVGLDIAHESNRYIAAKRARSSGDARITGPIVLVQDADRTPGFLFYAPFYERGCNDPEERRRAFSGMVYAPFVVKNLMLGTLDREGRHVGVRMTDQGEILYDEHDVSEASYDVDPLFSRSESLSLYGREWLFDLRSDLSFRNDASSGQPEMILAGGLCIDGLLLAILLLLSRSNRKAFEFTNQLRRKSEELERSNADLERFAYVTSHDLKTPLRGIGDLAEYIEEDLEPYFASPGADPSVRHNFERMRTQVDRMNRMIAGILHYSRIGGDEPDNAEIDVVDLLTELAADLQLSEGQVVMDCQPARIRGGVPLEQVVTNLVCNAIRHHDDPSHASIRFTVRSYAAEVQITVADDGPGIEEQYRDRIFEVFQTLRPKDETENTGIGLSIVKKIVDQRGGSISVASDEGCGATFKVRWPLEVELEQPRVLTKEYS